MDFWSFVKRYKGTVIVGAIIFAVALAGTIYGIATRAGDDGLMKQGSVTLHWDKMDFPLYCFKHSSVTEPYEQLYNEVISHINTSVTRPLLTQCTPWVIDKPFPIKPTQGTIIFRVGLEDDASEDGVSYSEPDDITHGRTSLYFMKDTGSMIGAIVRINSDEAIENRFKILLHEMLHALGLGHDRTKDSVMYPGLQDRPQKLTEKDIDVLKDTYIR